MRSTIKSTTFPIDTVIALRLSPSARLSVLLLRALTNLGIMAVATLSIAPPIFNTPSHNALTTGRAILKYWSNFKPVNVALRASTILLTPVLIKLIASFTVFTALVKKPFTSTAPI
ncbi:membrane protein [Candidatus Magnetobacterium bavaricum]|uniref:Membrane protein n=1 Tax=Candidatus Magnetobacterium bavaricum TaxID=29290 RepID=A0A0F3GNC0_9BACT|nr:membrane protein [Candidatus Magnetobacterium bavaricum]